MSDVVTVSQRKARETARRRAAADLIMAECRAFAASYGGRFLVFGSVAEDRMKFDSDFDVVVDFPEHEKEAVNFVEEACHRLNLPCDVIPKSTSSDRFLDRINNHAVPLP
jgi:predicted nucleotidyltransferase